MALGVEAYDVFKTLLVDTDKGLAFGIVPVEDQLDLKAITIGSKATMTTPAVAERVTGYVIGGKRVRYCSIPRRSPLHHRCPPAP